MFQKIAKNVTKTRCSESNKFMFYTTIKSKSRNICFNPKLHNPRKYLKKFNLSKKDHFKQMKNPQMSHINLSIIKKETKQLRNNLLPYYPKEHALRELTQLYFTGPHIIENTTGKICNKKTPLTYTNHQMYLHKISDEPHKQLNQKSTKKKL